MLSVATFASAAGATPIPPGPAAESLSQLRTEWAHALEQQDIEASMAMFQPDAVFLMPDGARYEDRAAIRTLYRSVMAAYHAHIELTSRREEDSGALDVDEGVYVETLTDLKTGKPLQVAGSYVMVARRQQDRSLKIIELIWTGPGPH